jgi:hypothetical protein
MLKVYLIGTEVYDPRLHIIPMLTQLFAARLAGSAAS